jgi:hypothetical protein
MKIQYPKRSRTGYIRCHTTNVRIIQMGPCNPAPFFVN